MTKIYRRNPFFSAEGNVRVRKLISKYIGYVAVYYQGKYYTRFYIQKTYRDLSFELLPKASSPSKAKRYYFENIQKVGITIAPLIFGDYFENPYSHDVAKKLVGYIDIASDLFANIRIYFPLNENIDLRMENTRSYNGGARRYINNDIRRPFFPYSSPVKPRQFNNYNRYNTASYKSYWRRNQITPKNW